MEDITVDQIPDKAHRARIQFGANQPDNRVVMRGRRAASRLGEGLFVKCNDTAVTREFGTYSLRPANVLLHVVLQGRAPFWLDDRPYVLERAEGQPVQVTLSALTSPAVFKRQAAKGDRMKKVAVRLEWDWFTARGIDPDLLSQGEPHRFVSWIAPSTLVEQARKAIDLSHSASGSQPMLRIQQEALALFTVESMLDFLQPPEELTADQRRKLHRMESFALEPGPLPRVSDIARVGGMSISSMHRLFAKVYGQPVMAYLRQRRLDRAADALLSGETIANAAHIGGYTSTGSFTTAFRKHTGVPPSEWR